MNRLQEKEKLFIQCEKDLKRIQNIHKEIKRIESNRKELENYYQNQYIKDYEVLENRTKHYKILNQDSIWNVLDEQYQEKIKIVKTIIQSI